MTKEQQLRKELERVCKVTKGFIDWLDAEMVKPSTKERGRRIANATNELELAIDSARFGVLGIDFRKELSWHERRRNVGERVRRAPGTLSAGEAFGINRAITAAQASAV